MPNHLVTTLLGPEQPRLLPEVLRLTTAYNCNLDEVRITTLNDIVVINLLINGSWDSIARLETALPAASEKLGMGLLLRRSEEVAASRPRMPYAVEVVTPDAEGIVHRLASFFAERDIRVYELTASVHPSLHTGSPMCIVNFTIHVPTDTYIGLLRSEFMEFCDANNYDAVLEPSKL